ncbi:MAG TPA: hypothetical protein VLK25_02895 [Allosphingosinicella sp.]|nr:hypothetical protein [Allosphingosinicella sp.]
MESVLLAASLIMATAPTSAPADAPVTAAALDQRCFRLMAELAEDRDPRIQGLGRVAAQYFLGRIDAAAPGFDLDAALAAEVPAGAERDALIGQCGDAMQAGGRDFRTIGRALAAPAQRPVA